MNNMKYVKLTDLAKVYAENDFSEGIPDDPVLPYVTEARKIIDNGKEKIKELNEIHSRLTCKDF